MQMIRYLKQILMLLLHAGGSNLDKNYYFQFYLLKNHRSQYYNNFLMKER